MIRYTTRLLVAAALLSLPAFAGAQQRPTATQAQQILQNNPQLVEQLRQRILSSGLTPDQVRARLRAEGYPENLLDAYLGIATEVNGSQPNADVFSAVAALGVADSLDILLLECGIDPDSLIAAVGTVTPLPGGAAVLRSERDTTAAMRDDLDVRKRRALAECQERVAPPRPGPSGPSQQPMDAADGSTIFGLATFRQPTTLFDANITGPVDANYRLGPGDRLVLVLTGDVEAAYQLDVTREGFVIIPQVGQLFVNSLTMAQLEDLLYSRLSRVYSGVRRGPGATTRFYITPSRLRSNQVFVHGDVMRPGSHRISSAGTAMTALYAARGPTENGSLRRVEVRRAGRIVEVLDVYDYLLRGDASRDVRLQNSDVVFVPLAGARVQVIGEVPRPATYELKEGETLADAIRFAGGFKPTASRSRVQVERILPPGQREPGGRDRVVTDIVSNELETGFGPSIPLVAGDVVRVFAIASRVRRGVTVEGNVWSPGSHGIVPGRTRVSDVLRAAGGVKPDTYLGQILVARLQSDSTRTQLRTSLTDTLGTVANDFLVQEDDEIRVFSRSEFREPRHVAITGAVRRSGRFPYREGMTVRDLILMAGGLEQRALLTEAEVARLPATRAGGRTAETFRIPLDSSYIFERGTDGRYFGPPGLPASNGPAGEVALQPYDNVLILPQPDWELQRTVVIAGEVRHPGHYALRTKTERVSDVVKRAGGITREGHPDGVTFYRSRAGIGRIGIELPNVLRNPRHRDNLILQDGDSIFIPRYTGVVHVGGAVNSPIAVAYVPRQSLDYYIRAAGGPSARADLSRAYVRQPNGKVEAVVKRPFAPDAHPRPRAGSTIFVPTKDPRDLAPNYAGMLTTLAQVLSTVIATIAVARTL